MKNIFEATEEEKNRIRGLHNINEQWSEVKMEETVEEDQFDTEEVQGLDEQGKSGLPKDGMPPVAPKNETEISPEMTHDQFMKQLDGMCPEIIEQEKMVGNRSCKKCHTDTMTLLRKYCLTRA